MPLYKFAVQFKDKTSGQGKNGIAVNADIGLIGTSGAAATDLPMTDMGYGGFFSLVYDTPTEGDWIINAKTDDTTVEAVHMGSWAAIEVPRIDAAVSSRSTLKQADILSDATPFPGAFIDAAISTAVCDGPGAAPYEIIINDPDGNPLDGVNVWITTDLAGANIIFNGFTDTFGKVTPMLDAGDYFAWKQLAGYTFTNPQAFSAP
jgi:hypothetical protein